MDFYIASIWSFGFNFPPVGFALCNGQLISIAQNEALFALIGTTYGGNGTTTFGLPNLQGRTPIGVGQGPGLPNYVIGQAAGSETVTLTTSNLPAHNHPVLSVNWPASARNNESSDPSGCYFGLADGVVGDTYNSTAGATMHGPLATTSGITGSNIPVSILSPFQVVSYCIATEGIFPSRN